MQSFFGSAIVLYAEKLIVQAVKASFHQNALRGRIEENARALWALDKLAAAKRSHRHRPAFRGFGHSRGLSAINTPALSRPVSRAGSPERRESYDCLDATDGRPGEAIVNVPLTPRDDRRSFSAPKMPPNLRQRPAKSSLEAKDLDNIDKGLTNPDVYKANRASNYFRRRAHSKTIAEQVNDQA